MDEHDGRPTHDARLDVDVAYAVCSRPERRAAIRALADEPRPVDVRDLADEVRGEVGAGAPVDDDTDAHDGLAAALYHVHLPVLAARDLVRLDAQRNAVQLLADGRRLADLLAAEG